MPTGNVGTRECRCRRAELPVPGAPAWSTGRRHKFGAQGSRTARERHHRQDHGLTGYTDVGVAGAGLVNLSVARRRPSPCDATETLTNFPGCLVNRSVAEQSIWTPTAVSASLSVSLTARRSPRNARRKHVNADRPNRSVTNRFRRPPRSAAAAKPLTKPHALNRSYSPVVSLAGAGSR